MVQCLFVAFDPHPFHNPEHPRLRAAYLKMASPQATISSCHWPPPFASMGHESYYFVAMT